MKHTLIFIFIIYISPACFCQSNKDIKIFFKLFKKDSLPHCVQYIDSDLSADTIFVSVSDIQEDTIDIPEEQDTIVDVLIYKTGIIPKNDSLLLPNKLNYNYLKYVLDTTLFSEFQDSISYKVFPLSLLIETKHFYGFTIEVEYEYPEPLSASKKYFITMNKKGNIFSLLEIGSRMYGGSGTAFNNVRSAWYAEMNGCINKDWTIIKDIDTSERCNKYKIDSSGKIIFIEAIQN